MLEEAAEVWVAVEHRTNYELTATLTTVTAADADSESNSSADLAAAIGRRREELFGPKPDAGRPFLEVESRLLGGAADAQGAVPKGASSTEVKYEMELGAHRETLEELLRAKDVLIARLEETVRDRDATIGQLLEPEFRDGDRFA